MERAVVSFGLNGDFAGISELNGVADEIDQDLSQATAIAMPWWQLRSDLNFECELFVGRQRLKCAADSLGDILNAVIRQFEDQLASLDLGQIEHIINEPEQMPTVGLKPFEYAEHLLGRFAR